MISCAVQCMTIHVEFQCHLQMFNNILYTTGIIVFFLYVAYVPIFHDVAYDHT